jgi:uncharacterized membrane protein
MGFTGLIEWVGKGMEAVGVAIIVAGALLATGRYLMGTRRARATHDAYRGYRRDLGRSILLGLEFLVAGDIIRTVVIEPTFRGVGTLAIIVAIRIVLSVELELEIDGRWPWQGRSDSGAVNHAATAGPCPPRRPRRAPVAPGRVASRAPRGRPRARTGRAPGPDEGNRPAG